MKDKIAEYWENRGIAEAIITAFYNHITKVAISYYTANDLLNAAKLAETRNCGKVSDKIWKAYF